VASSVEEHTKEVEMNFRSLYNAWRVNITGAFKRVIYTNITTVEFSCLGTMYAFKEDKLENTDCENRKHGQ